jgi:predicted CXXCH cytochrome family protein
LTRCVRTLFYLFAIGWLLAQAPLRPLLAAQSDPQPSTSNYVGAETCRGCHDDVYLTFADSAHQKLLANTDSATQGCEACHGPGRAHVDGNGDASRIFRFRDAKAAAVHTRCVPCHSDKSGGADSHSKMSCLTCHSVHHYREKNFLLVSSTPGLCRTCHPD